MIFQQDNDQKHTSLLCQYELNELGLNVLEWVAQSPDLNPIASLWAYLDRCTKDRIFNTKEELFDALKHAWEALPISYLTSLADSMPKTNSESNPK